jgi:hypothetical protein
MQVNRTVPFRTVQYHNSIQNRLPEDKLSVSYHVEDININN